MPCIVELYAQWVDTIILLSKSNLHKLPLSNIKSPTQIGIPENGGRDIFLEAVILFDT